MSERLDDLAAASAADAAAGPAAAAPLRLVVVDADDRTRESIVGLLSIRGRFRVVGNAGTPAAAVALVAQHRPDVVILDPRLPEPSGGTALIRRLRALAPDVHILALGGSPDLEQAVLQAGADTFVRKTFKPAELADAVGRCLELRPRSAASRVAAGPAADASPVPVPRPGTGIIL
jgi:DNA-binding NarL/FixJ family response regulator